MIGFIGGTGPEGRGLALRFAMAGEEVVIGSRSRERAQEAVEDVLGRAPDLAVTGAENADAAQSADTVFVAVPYGAHRDTVSGLSDLLKGKIVVDVVVPLAFEKGRVRALTVEEGSVAEQAQQLLPDAQVVGAFHSISAQELLVPDAVLDCDVVVCADDAEARDRVMALAELIKGVRALDGGGLATSRYVEALTALLLNMNRIYKAHSAIKIVGI